MTAEPTLEKTATNGIRTALGLGGALSVILGIVILVWPGKTAMVVTAIIAIYAIVAGLVYAGMGIFATGKGGWSRVGHVLLGVLYVVAGIVAFSNLGLAALSLAVFLGILVGIMWVIEGVVALSTLDLAPSRGWTIFYAIISIIAGVTLLFSPLWGAGLRGGSSGGIAVRGTYTSRRRCPRLRIVPPRAGLCHPARDHRDGQDRRPRAELRQRCRRDLRRRWLG